MNYFINSLFLQNFYINSPLINLNNINIKNSEFQYFFNSFIIVKYNFNIYQSNFNFFLEKVIKNSLNNFLNEKLLPIINLKNIQFQNIISTLNGGAIELINSKLNIINCIFIGCKASQGGAIYLSNSLLNITLTCFIQCISTNLIDNGGSAFSIYSTNLNSDIISFYECSNTTSGDSTIIGNIGIFNCKLHNYTHCKGKNGGTIGCLWPSIISDFSFFTVYSCYEYCIFAILTTSNNFKYSNIILNQLTHFFFFTYTSINVYNCTLYNNNLNNNNGLVNYFNCIGDFSSITLINSLTLQKVSYFNHLMCNLITPINSSQLNIFSFSKFIFIYNFLFL